MRLWTAGAIALCATGCKSKDVADAAPSRYRPVEIERECFVSPPTSEHPEQGVVAVHTVLESASGAKRAFAFALHLTCQYHGPHGGCFSDCPPGVDANREAGHHPNSWSCDVTTQSVREAALGFSVRTHIQVLGQTTAERWFGTPKVELHSRDFTIEHVGGDFVGRLMLACPRPLEQARDAATSSGCEVSIENEPTKERLAGPCSGKYAVPNLFTDRAAK